MSLNFGLIGRRIKEIRVNKKMSQAELAEKIDMSVVYISYIETASKQASLKSLVLIANVLCVTVDVLLNGNQTNDSAQYRSELDKLITDCNSYEKRVIFETAYAIKKSLRENRLLRHNSEK